MKKQILGAQTVNFTISALNPPAETVEERAHFELLRMATERFQNAFDIEDVKVIRNGMGTGVSHYLARGTVIGVVGHWNSTDVPTQAMDSYIYEAVEKAVGKAIENLMGNTPLGK